MAERLWQGNTDGTPFMHRTLIGLLRHIPLRAMYAFAEVFVVPFYMLFRHRDYLAIYRFFRRRMGESPLRAFADTYRDYCRFAQVILDRFCFYGGGEFTLDFDGADEYARLARSEGGFVIISAHVGNYEMAGYRLRSADKRMNVLVYGGEAVTVMMNRNRLFSRNNIRMIPVSDDMSHLFAINNALSEGESVSIPADRLFGSPRAVVCPFLGKDARFPLGPFAVAASRDLPVLAVNVMKTSARGYRIYLRRLDTAVGDTSHRAEALARAFAENLEDIVRRYPTQWFNFFDFWNDGNQ